MNPLLRIALWAESPNGNAIVLMTRRERIIDTVIMCVLGLAAVALMIGRYAL